MASSRAVSISLIVLTAAFSFMAQSAFAAEPSARTAIARAALPKGTPRDFGPAPVVADKAMTPELISALDAVFINGFRKGWGVDQIQAMDTIAASEDPRLAWIVTDMLRFLPEPTMRNHFRLTLNRLLDTELDSLDTWHDATDHLIAWNIPAPPDYLKYKRSVFTAVVPEWEPLFREGAVDWRHVAWGGVGIDDRPFDKTDEDCRCIPAADNPPVTSAKKAKWLDDDAIVFGITINGESRAYPRRIMEVREMVNDTLGGRHLGIPYCTLCGSAQAWYTDEVSEGIARPVLRTSGLLSRSNKVMYDLNTFSVFDTFLGTALAGPLHERGVELKQASVVTTTWGAWRKAHPDTTVLEEALALGRDFDFRNGRDANGPIFPIGDVDPRLAVQEDILGVVTESGTPVAFHVPSLITALDAGDKVQIENVEVVLDAGGVRAIDASGRDLGTHQAFWFAWSQFYPGTRLWPGSKN